MYAVFNTSSSHFPTICLTGFLFKATPNPTNPLHKQAANKLPNNRNAIPSQKVNPSKSQFNTIWIFVKTKLMIHICNNHLQSSMVASSGSLQLSPKLLLQWHFLSTAISWLFKLCLCCIKEQMIYNNGLLQKNQFQKLSLQSNVHVAQLQPLYLFNANHCKHSVHFYTQCATTALVYQAAFS